MLSIANARLAVNTNDIAGLILKYEFLVEFIELSSISNAAQRVLDVGATISSHHFRDEFPSYTNDIHAVLRAIPMYPPSEIPKDKLKSLLPHKRLVADDIIKASKMTDISSKTHEKPSFTDYAVCHISDDIVWD